MQELPSPPVQPIAWASLWKLTSDEFNEITWVLARTDDGADRIRLCLRGQPIVDLTLSHAQTGYLVIGVREYQR
jgi:hypothetical protein